METKEKSFDSTQKIEAVDSDRQSPVTISAKRSKNNVLLSPQPSDDPRDPLVKGLRSRFISHLLKHKFESRTGLSPRRLAFSSRCPSRLLQPLARLLLAC